MIYSNDKWYRIAPIFKIRNSERLEILGLTTLAECHARGDLIEVYKAKHDFSFTNNVFKFGRSGLNLLSKFQCKM